MRIALPITLIGLAACAHDSKSPPSRLDSPVAAAHCEAAAVRAKNVDQLIACFHPDLRADVRREVGTHSFDWTAHAQELDTLEHATAEQFTMKPMPPERTAYGDQIASLKLGKDSLDVVHARDGNWYVVDTGL